MKITFENYQEYVSDWMEGSLPKNLRKDFAEFLDRYPDVKQEIEELSQLSFSLPGMADESGSFRFLKKSVNDKIISVDNYQEFVVARLEGELNDTSLKALERFLNDHPYLQNHARLLGMTRLQPDETRVYEGKDKLMKPLVLDTASVTPANIDEVMIASLEGDLSPEQEAEFRKYLVRNPEAMLLFIQYQQTKLVPDEQIVFADKGVMKQKNTVLLLTRRNTLRVLGIAASIAFIAGIFIIDPNPQLLKTRPEVPVVAQPFSLPDTEPSNLISVGDNSAVTPFKAARKGNKAAVAEVIMPAVIIPVQSIENQIEHPKFATIQQTRLSGATCPDSKLVTDRNTGSWVQAGDPSAKPAGKKLTIDEFPIETIRLFTGGGNERPGLLAELSLPRIVEATDPHQILNNAGQNLVTRWVEWKERVLDEVIPYR